MAPRPVWTGTISFGLVSIPVRLFRAVSKQDVTFNLIDTRTNARIRQRRVSAADGSEVPSEALAKGYELPSGEYVIVSDDELANVEPERSRTVELEQFVSLEEIDPLFYDTAYLVAPDPAATKPYALLVQAMEEANKVGIARFVLRTKEYLAALRPLGGHLALSTMVYADELMDPAEIPSLEAAAEVEIADRELAMARQLVDSLSEPWDPARYHDTHREAILALIEQKASGAEPLATADAGPERDTVIDLMAALERSIAEAKEARGRHPSKLTDDEADAPAATPKPKGKASSTTKGKGKGKTTATTEEAAPTETKRPARRRAS